MRPLLSELLRPQEFDDLMQPPKVIAALKRMGDEKRPMNMLFYGAPGVGKTSATRILLKKLGDNSITLNGSLDNGVDVVRKLVGAASNAGIGEGPKVIFIDESEFMSPNAQGGLRVLIEKNSGHCVFILAANDISKFHPALKSRLTLVSFDLTISDAAPVIARLLPRYKATLESAGVGIDYGRLSELFHVYFPDLRSLANAIEFEGGVGGSY